MAAEGVQKEIVFPQSVLIFSTVADLEIREQLYRVYNEYIARQNALDPASFYGVGVCSNWWTPEKARDAVAQITALGLKALMLPNNPGKYPSGKDIAWGDAELEPFWDAVEEAALPVCFHVAEILQAEGRGVYPTFTLSSLAPFRKPFGQLAFGGVFDRNPTLKVVFVEGGISWVPVMLQDAENIFDGFGSLIEPRPKHRPSHYWFENCYATFQLDRLGLEWLQYIGPNNVMWGADYPHTEGTFGYTRHSRRVVREIAGGDAARKILGETATRVFKL